MSSITVAQELDDAIKMVTGKDGPFLMETRIAAITSDSLETIELMIALEIKFEAAFDDITDNSIHSGTYGELLDMLCAHPNALRLFPQLTDPSGSYGDMGVPGDNHWDHSKRGFQPK